MKLDLQEYVEKHCKYVNEQGVRNSADFISSLMEHNLIERLKEQAFLKQVFFYLIDLGFFLH